MEAFSVVDGWLEALIEDDEREVLAHLVSEVAELLGVDVAQRASELGLYETPELGGDFSQFDDEMLPDRDVGVVSATESAWEEITARLDIGDEDDDLIGPPADPAVARLLPPVSSDYETAEEFRRLTQHGLRTEKADRLVWFWVRLQPEHGPRFVATSDEGDLLASAITDIRLVLAQRLGIDSASDLDQLRQRNDSGDIGEHQMGLLQLSDVLAWWQESLLTGLLNLPSDQ